MSLGVPPLAFVKCKRGHAVVPSGFKIRTKSDGFEWIGETLVTEGTAQYRFSLADNPSIQSSWHRKPTTAYREAYFMHVQRKKPGQNGHLIIGVTYYPLQELIINEYASLLFGRNEVFMAPVPELLPVSQLENLLEPLPLPLSLQNVFPPDIDGPQANGLLEAALSSEDVDLEPLSESGLVQLHNQHSPHRPCKKHKPFI